MLVFLSSLRYQDFGLIASDVLYQSHCISGVQNARLFRNVYRILCSNCGINIEQSMRQSIHDILSCQGETLLHMVVMGFTIIILDPQMKSTAAVYLSEGIVT